MKDVPARHKRIFEEEDPLGVSLKKGGSMGQELMAYLIEGDGNVHSLPTEGLRLALEQVVQGNLAEKAGISCGSAPVYAFLHVLKWEMQAAKSAASAPE